MLFDWSLIIGGICLSKIFANNIIVYLISIFIIGSRQRAFDNLTHEASHGNLFKNKTLNNILSSLLSTFPIFTSLTAYRNSHLDHHRYLSDREKDPDTKRYKLFGLDKPPKNKIIFILLHVIRPLTLLHVPRYIYGTISSFLYSKNTPISEQVFRIGYWILIITLSINFGVWKDLVLFWIVPYITVLQVIRYYAEMSEHAGLIQGDNQFKKTRNVFGNKLFLKFMYPHHDHYHLIHHLFPNIPHYNLPKAHKILMRESLYCEATHCFGYFYSPYKG
ncbi:fatty acid desaturase family protein [Bacillus subtilis subsp. subtilis]